MARAIRVTVDGASALAVLAEDVAPRSAEALWSALPLERPLVHTKWSGAAATFAPPVAPSDEPEAAVLSLYPGVLALRPDGEALLSYGDAESRDELGVRYATRLARVVEGAALFARLRRMYDEGDARIRIERADAAPAPSRARRRLEVEVAGAKATYALLDERAPRTCDLLWEMLPIETTTFYSRWAGDAAVVETKPARVRDLLAGGVENAALSMYPGTLCIGPTPSWMDVYLSFGAAECRGATGRRYVTIAAELDGGDASGLFANMKGSRREGEKPVAIRRVA